MLEMRVLFIILLQNNIIYNIYYSYHMVMFF
jgi:hypothetical protein